MMSFIILSLTDRKLLHGHFCAEDHCWNNISGVTWNLVQTAGMNMVANCSGLFSGVIWSHEDLDFCWSNNKRDLTQQKKWWFRWFNLEQRPIVLSTLMIHGAYSEHFFVGTNVQKCILESSRYSSKPRSTQIPSTQCMVDIYLHLPEKVAIHVGRYAIVRLSVWVYNI